MGWDVEYTTTFEHWWNALDDGSQDSVAVAVGLLEEMGPHLPFPWSSNITGSRHAHMRELRVQHRGKPLRIQYAFDVRRTAILLLGGRKTDSARWYENMVPIADTPYDKHLLELKKEGYL